MNKICTSVEQSKKLIELGIDVNTADMWWAERYKRHATMDYKYIVEDEPYYYLSLTKPSNDNYSQDIVKAIPAWSLSALLKQLPYKLCNDDRNSYYLQINKEDNVYQLEYYIDTYGHFETIATDRYEHFVDACYEMIIRLYELNLL